MHGLAIEEILEELNEIMLRSVHSIVLTAFMMFPDDKDERLDFIFESITKFSHCECARLVASGVVYDKASQAASLLLADLINNISNITQYSNRILRPRKELFEQKYIDRFMKGMVIGHVLSISLGKKQSISASIKEYLDFEQNFSKSVDSYYYLKGVNFKFTDKNVECNIWPQFKNVAHCWAALIHFDVPRDLQHSAFIDFSSLAGSYNGKPFAGINDFCSLADHALNLGSQFTPPRSSRTLLDKKTAIKIINLEI